MLQRIDGTPYFNPSFGNRPLRTVGREHELALIRAGLASTPGSDSRAPIIIGQRSYGKTALLIEIESIATEMGFVCATTALSSNVLQNVLDGLQTSGGKALQQHGKLEGLTLGAFGFTFGLDVSRAMDEVKGFQAKLGIMLDRLEEAGLGACILIDELQPNFEEVRELTQAYQYHAGRGRNIALIMTGLPRCVSKVLNDKVSTFLYRAEKIYLGPIATSDIFEYFFESFGELGFHFEDGLMMKAAEAAGGMPYMMQLIGRNIASLANPMRDVTPETLDVALMLSKDKLFRNVFDPCVKTMSPKDRQLARAMLQDQNVSKAADLKECLGVNDEDYQQSRRRNIDNGIIVAKGYGTVAFSMPYFAEYLRGNEEFAG